MDRLIAVTADFVPRFGRRNVRCKNMATEGKAPNLGNRLFGFTR